MNRLFIFLLIFIFLYIIIRKIVKKNIFLKNSGVAYSYILGIIASALTFCMVLYPEEAFAAAVKGLDVWWNIVFPALLPFFIGSEILMGLGVVHFMGVLLEPLMRPLFRIPGAGSFAVAMGLASGFPIGAILTTKMRLKNLVTRYEGERLMSFTNTADPLFMFGAVAVGMFGYPQIGTTLALAHYMSSISVGIMMRFHGKDSNKSPLKVTSEENIVWRGLQALHEARLKDKRSLGQLMGDAVSNSANTLLMIGGFIILFSVIIKTLEVTGVIAVLSSLLYPVMTHLGINTGLSPAVISGFFEITLGCQLAGTAPVTIPLNQKIIITGSVIAWSGLSVHAQVASIISKTDMSIKPFVVARIIHAALAGFYTYLLTGPLAFVSGTLVFPTFVYTAPQGSSWHFWLERTIFAYQKFFLIMLLFLSISLVIYLVSCLRKRN